MRRTIAALAALPLALGAFAAHGGPDEEHMPDPIDFTFHLHGDEDVPLTDDEVYGTSGNQVMDTTAPTGDFQSRQLTNYVGGPNTACSDNAFFPTWVGYVGLGTVVGEATLEIDVIGGLGGNVDVRIWKDTTGGCNLDNVAPHAVKRMALPTGNGKLIVKIPLDGLRPEYEMRIMIVPPATSPTSQARFVYDGAEYNATLKFTCQPNLITYDEDGEPSHEPNCLPF